ncbi:hypothetical protein [Staphylococcus equorum]|uniref:hypothetical protein n=1 Tax=Staphylococcus equorum TaxID=246432 RepID=UPI003EBB8A5C
MIKNWLKKTIATNLENNLNDIESLKSTTITLFLIDMKAKATLDGLFIGIQM